MRISKFPWPNEAYPICDYGGYLKTQLDSLIIAYPEKLIDIKLGKFHSFYRNINFIGVFKRPFKTFSERSFQLSCTETKLSLQIFIYSF